MKFGYKLGHVISYPIRVIGGLFLLCGDFLESVALGIIEGCGFETNKPNLDFVMGMIVVVCALFAFLSWVFGLHIMLLKGISRVAQL